jgi:N-acetylmuramoyl-L-alanine amidase
MSGSRVTRRGLLARGALGAAALPLTGRIDLATGATPRGAVATVALPGAHRAAGWLVSAPVRAPRRFTLAGVSWHAGAAASSVEIRARRRGARWTAWTPLHGSGGHAPDGHAARRRPSQPAWLGPSDALQVRTRGTLRGVRAHLVSVSAPARVLSAAAAASPVDGRPAIIPRSAWGGGSRPPKEAPLYGDVELAFIHHTVNANTYGPGDSAGIVLAICAYHQDVNGWNDIGYNFLVDRYGQVFEGRAGGIDRAVVGAQAQGYNSVSTGVASVGTFDATGQTAAGRAALARLIAWKLTLHGASTQGTVQVVSAGGPTNRYAAGKSVTLQRISGHRDGDLTECPGSALYAQLPALRAAAGAEAGRLGATTPTPPAEPAQTAKPPRPVVLKLSKRRVRARGAVALSVSGIAPGASARVAVERRVGRAWRAVKTVKLRRRGATWTGVVRIGTPAGYRLRAVEAPTGRRSRAVALAVLRPRGARGPTPRFESSGGAAAT